MGLESHPDADLNTLLLQNVVDQLAVCLEPAREDVDASLHKNDQEGKENHSVGELEEHGDFFPDVAKGGNVLADGDLFLAFDLFAAAAPIAGNVAGVEDFAASGMELGELEVGRDSELLISPFFLPYHVYIIG